MERNGCAHQDWDGTKKMINIYGIAAGMAHLHSKNIVHRDLKPANILLDEFLYPKVADFGLSKILSKEDSSKMSVVKSGFKGTYAYCAPEIIREEKYTFDGDVYAYAFVVYEITTSELPFKGFNRFQLLHKIMNGYRPEFKYPIPYEMLV
ncbi:hypothetical protein M9Y10_014246 [Tritrichomonas musculus]|uniref:Protein kinase domain-containing protein n=1 Tax=Tritrichomonas musculus TaxID=1915356 RepID=A0ABR2KZ05_9EUKA